MPTVGGRGGKRGKKLQRLRSERVERSFAHVCETGGARRTWLHGIDKVRKRYQIAAAAHNLGVLMRHLFGIGTPRGLQAAGDLAEALYLAILAIVARLLRDSRRYITLQPTRPQKPAAA
jgi:transposase